MRPVKSGSEVANMVSLVGRAAISEEEETQHIYPSPYLGIIRPIIVR